MINGDDPFCLYKDTSKIVRFYIDLKKEIVGQILHASAQTTEEVHRESKESLKVLTEK